MTLPCGGVLARFYLDHNIATEEQVVEAAAELVRLSPDDAHAHDLRGWVAFQAGDYDTAESSLLRAISLDPMLAPGPLPPGPAAGRSGCVPGSTGTFHPCPGSRYDG